MKYYNEIHMRGVRETLETVIMKWPNVARKEMMGCLCYFRGSKFFAFLVTNGIVLTKLADGDRSKLSEQMDSKPFEMAGRTASNWLQVMVRKPHDLQPVLPYVKKSYDAASGR